MQAAVSTTPPSCSIIDGMCLIQRMHGENHTFAELFIHLFPSVLKTGLGSDKLDVVFDVYNKVSIKTAERVNRGSDTGVLFTTIMPGHKIKNWRRLLTYTSSKSKLIAFLAHDWKSTQIRDKLGSKVMYMTCMEKCFKLTKETAEEVDELKTSQEEADTRILLYAKQINHSCCR